MLQSIHLAFIDAAISPIVPKHFMYWSLCMAGGLIAYHCRTSEKLTRSGYLLFLLAFISILPSVGVARDLSNAIMDSYAFIFTTLVTDLTVVTLGYCLTRATVARINDREGPPLLALLVASIPVLAPILTFGRGTTHTPAIGFRRMMWKVYLVMLISSMLLGAASLMAGLHAPLAERMDLIRTIADAKIRANGIDDYEGKLLSTLRSGGAEVSKTAAGIAILLPDAPDSAFYPHNLVELRIGACSDPVFGPYLLAGKAIDFAPGPRNPTISITVNESDCRL